VGHQVHVSLPINQFLNAGVDPKEIPLPHEFILGMFESVVIIAFKSIFYFKMYLNNIFYIF